MCLSPGWQKLNYAITTGSEGSHTRQKLDLQAKAGNQIPASNKNVLKIF